MRICVPVCIYAPARVTPWEFLHDVCYDIIGVTPFWRKRGRSLIARDARLDDVIEIGFTRKAAVEVDTVDKVARGSVAGLCGASEAGESGRTYMHATDDSTPTTMWYT